MAAPADERGIKSSHISLEIVEEIIANLPVKSLLRFSMVSKSWNSLIFHPRFIKSHKKRRVSNSFRQITVYSPHYSNRFLAINGCGGGSSLSPIPLDCILNGSLTYGLNIILLSSCDELWCIKFENTIYLWNPSMRTYREIPNSGHIVGTPSQHWLGYNSSRDDYNILYYSNHKLENAELYSLRNNSWKKIFPNLPLEGSWNSRRFHSGFGAIHGILYPTKYGFDDGRKPTIVCFDLSTETYKVVVVAPPYSPETITCDFVEIGIVREKLCAQVVYMKTNVYVLWVMQEYGEGKSWSKLFEIDCRRFLPYSRMKDEDSEEETEEMDVTAMDFDGDGKIIVIVEFPNSREHAVMEVEKDEERMIFYGSSEDKIFTHLYVETLVSPVAYGGGGGGGKSAR